MEETFKKEVNRKEISRLQRRAPASLQIDTASLLVINRELFCSKDPIPLLSPLVLSPPPLSDLVGQGREGEWTQPAEASWSPPSEGWQHPAMPAALDPSTLLSFFQSQCVFVNDR
ncbi:uncharacterized protein At4g14450, chloroplastic-like [Aristolochia californica]|uniref:uncharacterized protein At4g14450, chloroplastic-like n=1 Tax=Aristolochia californica TaxID=171875 RepID=UPI0035E010E8